MFYGKRSNTGSSCFFGRDQNSGADASQKSFRVGQVKVSQVKLNQSSQSSQGQSSEFEPVESVKSRSVRSV